MKKVKENSAVVLDITPETNNANATAVEILVADVTANEVEVMTDQAVEVETPRLGRPVDPTSPRQIKLAEDAAGRLAGTLKRGRPSVEGSANQVKVAEREARIAAGGSVERGRPILPESPRQIRLAKMKAKFEAGISVKPGRPSFAMVEQINKVTEPAVEEIAVETEKA